jgi:hypothetical protein
MSHCDRELRARCISLRKQIPANSELMEMDSPEDLFVIIRRASAAGD